MKKEDLKDLLIRSLDIDSDPQLLSRIVEKEAFSCEFPEGFTEKVLKRVYNEGKAYAVESEFLRRMNLAFYRIVLTGIAAAILLIISILIGQGTISSDSLLGLGDSADESIVCLLTGK